jgi:signal transduction histidine kinase
VTFSDGSYAFLTWQYKAQFTNKTLRTLFPNFEILFLIGIALILISYFIWFTKKTSNYLQAKLALVEQASLQIAQENLDSKIDDSTDILEFNRVLQSMEGMRVALKESLVQQWETQEQRKQEIAALTHDINTPLTVINGNAELLLEESLDSEQQQLVQHIYESGIKTKQYIDLLQQVSNFDVVHEEKEQISLEDVKEELAQVLSQLAKQKEIALEVQSETMATIFAAPTMLMRALVNLGENAIRHTEVGKVLIRMEKQRQKFFFVFEDNGPGFSSEALMHGKEMFWQQDQSRSGTSNYGIGLSIVERVAQYHKGELRLENTQKGGKVTLILSNE